LFLEQHPDIELGSPVATIIQAIMMLASRAAHFSVRIKRHTKLRLEIAARVADEGLANRRAERRSGSFLIRNATLRRESYAETDAETTRLV
jgi:hypothetical protein